MLAPYHETNKEVLSTPIPPGPAGDQPLRFLPCLVLTLGHVGDHFLKFRAEMLHGSNMSERYRQQSCFKFSELPPWPFQPHVKMFTLSVLAALQCILMMRVSIWLRVHLSLKWAQFILEPTL